MIFVYKCLVTCDLLGVTEHHCCKGDWQQDSASCCICLFYRLWFYKKLRKFTYRLNSKISVRGTSCWSYDQLRLIFSLRTHRISIRIHMQDHNIPLCLFIISVYILTVLVLWNIFSNGHVTVMSCLFLQYNPSTNPKNRVHLLWKVGKVLMDSLEWQIFALFHISKWLLMKERMKEIPKDLIRKYFICYMVFQFF